MYIIHNALSEWRNKTVQSVSRHLPHARSRMASNVAVTAVFMYVHAENQYQSPNTNLMTQ